MSPSVEWGVPTAVVRDDDGVVCSGEEGGTTVVRSRKKPQAVDIASTQYKQADGRRTLNPAHTIRGAPEPDVRIKKTAAQVNQGQARSRVQTCRHIQGH